MNSLKRIFITLKGQIDSVADEFENHEALAGAAIKDLEVIGSKTSIHLHRTKAMISQYEKKIAELNQEAERWSARAVKVRAEDEQKALQCVKRLRLTRQQLEQMEQQLQESRKLELKVQADLNNIQIELQTLTKKKELLSARQNRTQVQAVIAESYAKPGDDLRDVFARWENSVVGAEFQYPEIPDQDSFCAEFEQQEDEVDLKMMLDELTEQSTSDKPE